jgi:hypothetical protein
MAKATRNSKSSSPILTPQTQNTPTDTSKTLEVNP